MSTLLNTFANNLLPILLISGAGFILGKLFPIDPRSIGRILFYILSPVLIFKLLTQNPLPVQQLALMMGFASSVTLVIGLLAFLLGKLFRLSRTVLVAVLLTAMFANNGNYGLPLILFAFGQEAMAYASIYFVTCSILTNTVGMVIASMGSSTFKKAFLGLVKVPTVYAILAAMIVLRFDWTLPLPLLRTVNLVGDATIPMMIILLGIELSRIRWSSQLKIASLPTILRLGIGPLVGMLLAIPFGLQGTARQAGITESGMPSAVLVTVLANEYQVEPELVTAIVFLSTVLSPFTLTPLLVFLGSA